MPSYFHDRRTCSTIGKFDECNKIAHCRWNEKDTFEKSLELYSFSKSRESFCYNLAGVLDAFASASKEGVSINSTSVCMEHLCPVDSAELCPMLTSIFGFEESESNADNEGSNGGRRKRSLLSLSKESPINPVYGEAHH